MKRKRSFWVAAALFGGFVLLAVVIGARRPSHPVATIKVVDPSGKPIAGAVITPDGLRPKRGGGHYFWTERRDPKPTPVQTDAAGVAAVAYPFYTDERLETGEISFRVEHPDYCLVRPFRTVNAAPPGNAPLLEKVFHWTQLMIRNVQARPPPVVLEPGAIVEVSGYLDATNRLVSPLFVQVADVWEPQTNSWRQIAPGRWTSRQIPEGNRVLRLVHVPPDQPACFSEPVGFRALPGRTNRFHLALKPGNRIVGRLDASVPRPVASGVVVLEVVPDESQPRGESVVWHTWSPIDANGTFRFDGLPPGKVEIVALCDGHVSRDGESNRRGIRGPQKFLLTEPELTVDLAMEPTATFELTALDDRGQFIEGATVNFWPNVIWGNRGTTIFCSDLYHTLDGLPHSAPRSSELREQRPASYAAKTGPNGVALVTNLPAHADAFSVTHSAYELPVRKDASGQSSRQRTVRLRPGEAVRQTVTLHKRGQDHVEHSR
jgi:hypothetical protein